MNGPVTYDELAALMKERAGLVVDPWEMENRPDSTFEEFELDSLGLLGIVSELEKRHGPTDRRRGGDLQDAVRIPQQRQRPTHRGSLT